MTKVRVYFEIERYEDVEVGEGEDAVSIAAEILAQGYSYCADDWKWVSSELVNGFDGDLEEGIVVADWCEHCGKMEMQKMYFDGGTYWCL